MAINNDLYQSVLQILIIFLGQPAVFAIIGTTTARILAQDGFSEQINGAIAWVVLVGSAIGSAWAGHEFISNDPIFILGVVVGAITLLLSGAFASVRPYLIYLDWIETHIFNIVPVPAQSADEESA